MRWNRDVRWFVIDLVAIVVTMVVLFCSGRARAEGRRCSLVRERPSGGLIICTYDCPSGLTEMTVRRRCPRVIDEPR